MSTLVSTARHRDSPRTRRLARLAGVDLATIARTGPHGRATAVDVAAATSRPEPAPTPVPTAHVPTTPVLTTPVPGAAPAPPPAVAGACSLLEVDVSAFLRGAVTDPRTRLLAAAVGSLARGVADLRPAGLPSGPVAVRVVLDDGPARTVADADLLSATGLAGRLTGPSDGPAAPAGSDIVLHVVDAGRSAATVEVRPAPPGALAVVAVGQVVRRAVVVVDDDGREGLGIRPVAWLALSTSPALDGAATAALLARLRDDLTSRPGVAR